MAFPRNWTNLRVGLEGEALDTARYHALGNAVTPPVAEWIANRIRTYLAQEDSFAAERESEVAAATA
jgi:DNA (cytosine-5)-methyltransferase 1